jgi:hypothetical protein
VEGTLTVNKKTPIITILGITNGTYPDLDTIYFDIDNINDLFGSIYYNGTPFTNNTSPGLGAGSWNITAKTDGNVNYTSSSSTVWYDIFKTNPTSGMSLNLDQDPTSPQIRTYPNITHFVGTETNPGDSDMSYQIKENNTIQGSTDYNKQLAAGDYNITYYTEGGENYTSGQVETDLTVNKGSSAINPTSINGWSFDYNEATTLDCSIVTGDISAGTELYVEDVNHTDDWKGESIIIGAKFGTGQNITCKYTESENYTNSQGEQTLSINRINPVLDLSSSVGWSIGYGTSTNITGSTNTGLILFIDKVCSP